jgi:hypothetical protein
VSSSGHLQGVPYLLGWETGSLTFDVMVHGGTLVAVIAYFREDLWYVATRSLGIGIVEEGEQRRALTVVLLLAVGTVPRRSRACCSRTPSRRRSPRPGWSPSSCTSPPCCWSPPSCSGAGGPRPSSGSPRRSSSAPSATSTPAARGQHHLPRRPGHRDGAGVRHLPGRLALGRHDRRRHDDGPVPRGVGPVLVPAVGPDHPRRHDRALPTSGRSSRARCRSVGSRSPPGSWRRASAATGPSASCSGWSRPTTCSGSRGTWRSSPRCCSPARS